MTSPHKIEPYNYGVPDDRAEFVRGNERAIIHAKLAELHQSIIIPRKGPDWRFASWVVMKAMAEIIGAKDNNPEPPELLQP